MSNRGMVEISISCYEYMGRPHFFDMRKVFLLPGDYIVDSYMEWRDYVNIYVHSDSVPDIEGVSIAKIVPHYSFEGGELNLVRLEMPQLAKGDQ